MFDDFQREEARSLSPGLLAFVEKVAVEEILLGVSEDRDSHAVRSLNSFLIWFQSS